MIKDNDVNCIEENEKISNPLKHSTYLALHWHSFMVPLNPESLNFLSRAVKREKSEAAKLKRDKSEAANFHLAMQNLTKQTH
jgi:hypothetical protein